MKDVKEAEIKFCGYFVEHNLTFNSFDHLSGVLKSVFNDSKIAKSVTLGRTKTTGIIKNVIGKCHTEDLTCIMKTSKFSTIIDELHFGSW